MVYKREEPDEQEEGASQGSSDFANLLEQSFEQRSRRLKVGDRVRCEVLSLGREYVIVSTPTAHDGLVARTDVLGDDGEPKVKVGEKIDLFVVRVRGDEIYLSPKLNAKGSADGLEDAFARGVTLEGKVDEVCNGGFRISIQGKRAFCPISQLDSIRIETPEDYVGKKFEFKITQISEGGRNIVVSRRKVLDEQKALSDVAFFEKHKVGDTVTGTVSRLEKFGAFIELAPGLEGLAHISELSWSRVNTPSEVLELGQHVTAKILKVETDGSHKKISLSIKQNQAEPWTDLPNNLQEGAVVSGKVTRCLKFGAFVEVAPGIEGLIPLSEMSYTKRVSKSDELVKPGEIIRVKINQIDAFAKRIALSLKDAEGSDPWSHVEDRFKVGSLVEGIVERREAFGLFISLGEGIVGLLPKSRGVAHPEFSYDRLRPNDKVKVRIAEIKVGERKISLDAPGADVGEADWKDYQSKQSKSSSSDGTLNFTALGSQLKAAMEKARK